MPTYALDSLPTWLTSDFSFFSWAGYDEESTGPESPNLSVLVQQPAQETKHVKGENLWVVEVPLGCGWRMGWGGGIQYVGSERPRRGCSCEAGDGEVKFGIMGGSWRLFLRGWRVMGEMWDHVGGECYFSGARGWRTKCWIKTAPENWVGEHKNIEKRMSVVPVTLRLPGGFPWKGKHLLKIPFLQLWSTKKCRS